MRTHSKSAEQPRRGTTCLLAIRDKMDLHGKGAIKMKSNVLLS
jgi:hypothetical protein